MQAFMNALSPGYFATMNIAMLEGRDFNRADMKEHATTAIVNRKVRRSFLPGASAIGKHIGNGTGSHRQVHYRDRWRRRQRTLRGTA
jgi:hypothetical protein